MAIRARARARTTDGEWPLGAARALLGGRALRRRRRRRRATRRRVWLREYARARLNGARRLTDRVRPPFDICHYHLYTRA